jgi:peptide/nickel transport system permease protein
MIDKGKNNLVAELPDRTIPTQETMSQVVWKNFKRHPMGIFGIVVLLIIILFSVFAFLLPQDPLALDTTERLTKPSAIHIFGTDRYGRDIFTRIAYGGRISLMVGLLAMTAAAIIGTIIGGITGYYGGIIDVILMRLTEFFLSFPQIFVLLFLSFILRESKVNFLQGGMGNIVLVIGATSWMTVARLVRATFLKLRESEFVRAARSYGASNFHIILYHILPNAFGPIIVSSTMGTAWAIIIESGLSFLGYGIQQPTPTWGNMLQEGRSTIGVYPWITFFPGAMIFFTVISLNYIGDALRDALDPYKFVGIKK